MSSAIEGWYVDPSTGTNLRYWNGTTWTDEVAPLPHASVHSGPIDPFARDDEAVPDQPTEQSADSQQHDEVEPLVFADLDPTLERTQLTRRELRARRQEPPPDDAPKHLPPMTMPAAISVTQWASTQQEPAPWEFAPSAETVSTPATSAQPAARVTTAQLAPVQATTEYAAMQASPLQANSAQAAAHDDVVDVTAAPMTATPADPERAAARVRVLRLSVLLGILAVVSSIAVLTGGTI